MTKLCEITIDMCIGEREVWTPVFRDDKMLAFQHHGMIFVQNAALHQTLDLQSCFIHLLSGAIIADGEEKMKLYTYSTQKQKMETMTDSSRQTHKLFTPVDLFPGISFSTRLEIAGESIYIQQDALVKDRICAIPSPGIISKSLAGLYVTANCDHRYDSIVATTELEKNVSWLLDRTMEQLQKEVVGVAIRNTGQERPVSSRPDTGSVPKKRRLPLAIKQGLFLPGAEYRSSMLELWLQAVDQNAPGQWLAYHHLGNLDDLTVLQRGCCTACACRMTLNRYQSYPREVGICRIIHGRFAGEDME